MAILAHGSRERIAVRSSPDLAWALGALLGTAVGFALAVVLAHSSPGIAIVAGLLCAAAFLAPLVAADGQAEGARRAPRARTGSSQAEDRWSHRLPKLAWLQRAWGGLPRRDAQRGCEQEDIGDRAGAEHAFHEAAAAGHRLAAVSLGRVLEARGTSTARASPTAVSRGATTRSRPPHV